MKIWILWNLNIKGLFECLNRLLLSWGKTNRSSWGLREGQGLLAGSEGSAIFQKRGLHDAAFSHLGVDVEQHVLPRCQQVFRLFIKKLVPEMDSFFITSEHPGFDEEIRTGFSFIQMTDVGL